jgi:hypothetical protein
MYHKVSLFSNLATKFMTGPFQLSLNWAFLKPVYGQTPRPAVLHEIEHQLLCMNLKTVFCKTTMQTICEFSAFKAAGADCSPGLIGAHKPHCSQCFPLSFDGAFAVVSSAAVRGRPVECHHWLREANQPSFTSYLGARLCECLLCCWLTPSKRVTSASITSQ